MRNANRVIKNAKKFLEEANKIAPDVIKILLTGFSDIEIITDAVNKCNLFQYVLKPFNPDELQEAVRIIENTGSANLINSLVKNRIQVKFYDLSMISYEYAKHYAMRVDTSAGKQYILINSRFEIVF